MSDDGEFVSIGELTKILQGQIHPVILKSTDDQYPYYGVGTAFILEFEQQLFVVTAKHILDSQHATSSDLQILLRKNGYSVQFDAEAVFQPDYSPHFDLVILRIAAFQQELLRSLGAYWINLTDSIADDEQPNADHFCIVGYSEDDREYNYEQQTFTAELSILEARLTTPQVDGLSTLHVFGERPSSFRGLSGSLVVANVDGIWKLAGMLALAHEETGILNFISADTIGFYLIRLIDMIQRGENIIDRPVS
ncbi:hypothetical protein NAU58_21090 [Pseudomonas stutzeri]|uniref:hypothetical protein n=1 Tax=Stutzerimonas stutzeri TaxID=316 RepID=UPI00210B3258|nr:hypothetical protein [Stutzerimonas stutzeri]MCQ4298077.1 hypothetical protein [Stutzerimonas stutzeri]